MSSNNGYTHPSSNYTVFMRLFREAFPQAPKGEAERIFDKDRCEKVFPSFANMYRLAMNHYRHHHTAYEVELQAAQARIKAKYTVIATERLAEWAQADEPLPLFSAEEV